MFNREFVRFIRTTRDGGGNTIRGSNELFFDNCAYSATKCKIELVVVIHGHKRNID